MKTFLLAVMLGFGGFPAYAQNPQGSSLAAVESNAAERERRQYAPSLEARERRMLRRMEREHRKKERLERLEQKRAQSLAPSAQ